MSSDTEGSIHLFTRMDIKAYLAAQPTYIDTDELGELQYVSHVHIFPSSLLTLYFLLPLPSPTPPRSLQTFNLPHPLSSPSPFLLSRAADVSNQDFNADPTLPTAFQSALSALRLRPDGRPSDPVERSLVARNEIAEWNASLDEESSTDGSENEECFKSSEPGSRRTNSIKDPMLLGPKIKYVDLFEFEQGANMR